MQYLTAGALFGCNVRGTGTRECLVFELFVPKIKFFDCLALAGVWSYSMEPELRSVVCVREGETVRRVASKL